MPDNFNNRLRQLLLLLLIIVLGLLLLKELYIFLPGILGAVTIYILSRKLYQDLTVKKNGQKALPPCCSSWVPLLS